MRDQRIGVRRDGDRIALDSVQNDSDFRGITQTTWFGAQDAIDVGSVMVQLGRLILRGGQSP
jgi:hypothetical protein